jgi:DNA mismatch endonuclease (patch repair protein)
MDWLRPEQRSRNMSAIRSRGNSSTEQALRFRLVRAGVRGWKLCSSDVVGKPDFVFSVERVAIFVDGCYWHGCPRCYRAPTSNTGYWGEKYSRNKRRDRAVSRFLRREGWRVLRIWEHEVNERPQSVIERVKILLLSQPPALYYAATNIS